MMESLVTRLKIQWMTTEGMESHHIDIVVPSRYGWTILGLMGFGIVADMLRAKINA